MNKKNMRRVSILVTTQTLGTGKAGFYPRLP